MVDDHIRRLERAASAGDPEAYFRWIIAKVNLGEHIYGVVQSRVEYSDYGDYCTNDLYLFREFDGKFLWGDRCSGSSTGFQARHLFDPKKRPSIIFPGHPDSEDLFRCNTGPRCQCRTERRHPYQQCCPSWNPSEGWIRYYIDIRTCIRCGSRHAMTFQDPRDWDQSPGVIYDWERNELIIKAYCKVCELEFDLDCDVINPADDRN